MDYLNKHEKDLADKYSAYNLRSIFLILENYEEMDRKVKISNKSEDDILQNFCKYLRDTGTEVNQSDIDLYYEMRESKKLKQAAKNNSDETDN